MRAELAVLDRDITPAGGDYELVRRVIEKISLDYRQEPTLEQLAADVGVPP
ncbi:6-O-methylguanine DNA methyltransferase, partial [Chelativorans composti]